MGQINNINAILRPKYKTHTYWLSIDTDASPFIPVQNEIIYANVATDLLNIDRRSAEQQSQNSPKAAPTVLCKIGDGVTRYKDLQWIGALAADVYDWAKSENKPTYTASEISGIDNLGNIRFKGAITLDELVALSNLKVGDAYMPTGDMGSTSDSMSATITMTTMKAKGVTFSQYDDSTIVMSGADRTLIQAFYMSGSFTFVPASSSTPITSNVLELTTNNNLLMYMNNTFTEADLQSGEGYLIISYSKYYAYDLIFWNGWYWELFTYNSVRSDDVLTKDNTTSYTPTNDYNPSTKKYVDDKATSLISRIDPIDNDVHNLKLSIQNNTVNFNRLKETKLNYSNYNTEFDKSSRGDIFEIENPILYQRIESFDEITGIAVPGSSGTYIVRISDSTTIDIINDYLEKGSMIMVNSTTETASAGFEISSINKYSSYLDIVCTVSDKKPNTLTAKLPTALAGNYEVEITSIQYDDTFYTGQKVINNGYRFILYIDTPENYVKKEQGKGLSQNDYTASDKAAVQSLNYTNTGSNESSGRIDFKGMYLNAVNIALSQSIDAPNILVRNANSSGFEGIKSLNNSSQTITTLQSVLDNKLNADSDKLLTEDNKKIINKLQLNEFGEDYQLEVKDGEFKATQGEFTTGIQIPDAYSLIIGGDLSQTLGHALDKKADKDDLTSVYKVKGSLDLTNVSNSDVSSWIYAPENGDVYNIEKVDKSGTIGNDYLFNNVECSLSIQSDSIGILTFTDADVVTKLGNGTLEIAPVIVSRAANPDIPTSFNVKFDKKLSDLTVQVSSNLDINTLVGNYRLLAMRRVPVKVAVGDNVVWIDNYGWDKLASNIDLSNYVTTDDERLSKIYHVTEGNKDILDIDSNSYLRVQSFDKIINSEGSSIQTELNNKLDKSAVVNTLTSSSTTNPLSAEQGRVLNVTTVKMTGNQQISGYKYFSQGLFATYPVNRHNNPFDDSTDATTISPTSVINYQYLENYSNSKRFKPSQIMPQNDSTAGIVPLTYGAETHSVRNVSSFLPADAISIEYTTDGGTTWTDYGASDEVKRKIFAEDTTKYIKIGGENITTDTITDQCMTRVTIDPMVDKRYSNAFMFYCWVTTAGVKDMKCKIECSTIGAPDTFTTVRDEVTVSGWSGPNTITFTPRSFGGGANQTTNQRKFRFTFRSLQPNNKIASFTDLRLYGYSVWTPKNNYMKAGTIYSTSYDQNVTFPAQLSANTLEIENNGSIGTNLTNAIQSITNDIPVATTVPATLAVNTIYDVGQQTTLNLTLPTGKVGNYIQVDFLSPSTPTTLGINSEAGISDFSLIPSANTIYSLYFEWGTLYYNSTTSKCVYGWRFKYDEYTHTV